MFGRKKRNKYIEVTRLSSLIADNLHVVGDVHFTGGLRIDGRVEGKVVGGGDAKSLVVLSEKGCVVGGVHSYDAVINGRILGDLVVDHFLELQAGASVSGNIRYRQLQMDCGACVEGKLVRVEDEVSGEAGGTEADKKQAATVTEAHAPARESRGDALDATIESSNTPVSAERPASAAAAQISADRAAVRQSQGTGDAVTNSVGASGVSSGSR